MHELTATLWDSERRAIIANNQWLKSLKIYFLAEPE